MSGRTIVAIEAGQDDALLMKLLRAPAAIPGGQWLPFECNPDGMPSWTDPDAVRLHGQRLYESLRAHPSIGAALSQLLTTPAGDECSLYLRLMAQDAERLCWETLYDQHSEFLALDRRWPVARMADAVLDRPDPPRAFEPPLRVAAIISALGIDGVREWTQLRDAVVDHRARGLAIRIHVITGQQPVLDAVAADQAGGLTEVTAQLVPADRVALEAALAAAAPHVVHFFCHGSINTGVAQLEIATRLDELGGAPTASLRLRINDLRNMTALRGAWLVVLNCCKGGRSTDRLHSIAYQLVAEVVPAAVGMLEPVDATDAHLFARHLYGGLFQQIHDATSRLVPGSTEPVHWCRALHAPRSVLRQRHADDPANHREWSLPVLYVRPDPFEIRLAEPALSDEALARMRDDAREVAAALQALPPSTPLSVRQQLLLLVAHLPPSMRPGLDGAFTEPI